MKDYVGFIGVALTQLINTLLGGFPDETTSSRMWRWHLQGKPEGTIFAAVIDTIFFWQGDHCRKAYEAERTRYHLPPILR